MKIFLFLSTLLFSFITSQEEKQCHVIYKIPSTAMESTKCRTVQVDVEKEIKTINCQKCPKNQYCSINYVNQTGICVSENTNLIPGKKCTNGTDCYSGKCENNICVAKSDNEACSISHGECAKDHLCGVNSVCIPIVKEGERCENDFYCPIGHECLFDKDGSRKCKKMFSIERGNYSSQKSLCKSGYMTSENICADTKLQVNTTECTMDEECALIVDDGSTNTTANGQCVCTYEGKRYCALPSTSDEWKNYVETFNKEIEKMNVSNIHVAYQRIHNGVFNYWGDKTIRDAYIKFDAKYKNVNATLIDILNNDRADDGRYLKVSFIIFTILMFIIA